MLDCVMVHPMLLAAGTSGASGMTSFILLLGPLILIWYLLIIRPQGRQRRKTQEMLSNLKTGDRVSTTGGILGTIVGFGSSTVHVQIANQVKVEVLRSAINGLQHTDESPAPKSVEAAAVAESQVKGRK